MLKQAMPSCSRMRRGLSESQAVSSSNGGMRNRAGPRTRHADNLLGWTLLPSTRLWYIRYPCTMRSAIKPIGSRAPHSRQNLAPYPIPTALTITADSSHRSRQNQFKRPPITLRRANRFPSNFTPIRQRIHHKARSANGNISTTRIGNAGVDNEQQDIRKRLEIHCRHDLPHQLKLRA